jgi:DNA-binding HxlR family transcriptional regulator
MCSVALALDMVGDRWTLLIVRELLIAPRLRFSDLRQALPGVAPNLLTQRLRDLEANGVARRELATAPASGSLYALTDRGRQLEGVVRELMRWGAPGVASAPAEAIFQMHWLSLPAKALAKDNAPHDPAVTVRFGEPADGFDLTADAGAISVSPCLPATTPDAAVRGPGEVLVGLFQGAIDMGHAASMGVEVDGDLTAFTRILPSKQG